MIKPISIVTATLVCSLAASAQTATSIDKNSMVRTAGKTTGVESRLVGYARWWYDDNNKKTYRSDSSYYKYSGNNGWGGDLFWWKYDTQVQLKLDSYGLNNNLRATNIFDAQKRIVERKFEAWIFNQNRWEESQKIVYTYNALGQLTADESQILDAGNWSVIYRTQNVYDTNGSLIESIGLQRDNVSGQLINYSRAVNVYNVARKLESTSLYAWDPSGWTPLDSTVFFYSGNLLSQTHRYIKSTSGGSLTPWRIKTSVYDGNGHEIETKEKWCINGVWEERDKTLRNYDAGGNEIETIYQNYNNGSYVNGVQILYSYNGFNQILTEVRKDWNTSTNQFEVNVNSDFNYYYYEQFTNDIKENEAQAGALDVYPNPASNTLTLSLDETEMRQVTVTLLGLDGRVIKQWELSSILQPVQTLDISGVPSGAYVLKVMSLQGLLSRQISVIK